jgi:alpha-1,2-glucosyltransferase
MSTAAVLINYHAFLETTRKPHRSISDDLIAVLSGIAALFFRQTNIFWVAVFPAGLTVLEVLKNNRSMMPNTVRQGYLAILKDSWAKGVVYDRSLRDGGLAIPGMLFLDWRTTWLIQQDVLLFLLTTVIATLSSPTKVLRSIASYIFLLVLFAGFVAWNGSVVLGK